MTVAADLPVPVAPAALPALDDAPLLTAIGRTARRGRWVLLAWGAAMALWALAAPISGGVVASGLVKVEADRQTISHRDGGTVARILAREGQRVAQGQVLVELADTRIDASVELLRGQLAADRLRQSRLEAEAAGAASWTVPEALAAEFAGPGPFAEQAAKERAAFRARRDNLVAQIEGERRQAEDTRTEIAVRLRERDNAARAVAAMKEELALNRQLEAGGFVNRARVLTLERAVSEYETRGFTNEAELAQARQRLGALESRIRALADGLKQQATEELREVGARVADTTQRLRASTEDRERQTIVAPAAGVLVNLRVNTVGSAIGPREPIVDLVPEGAALQVDVRLPVDVAAEVHAGLEAEVRLMSAQARFDRLLPATVLRVSADALADERNGAPYLAVSLGIAPEAMAASDTRLQPGMAAEVYIKTAERTPMGFLMQPITGYFRRAFKEH
jgi:HlyD family type I secretion membrane fusion protein